MAETSSALSLDMCVCTKAVPVSASQNIGKDMTWIRGKWKDRSVFSKVLLKSVIFSISLKVSEKKITFSINHLLPLSLILAF